MPGQIGSVSIGVPTYGGATPFGAITAPTARPQLQVLANFTTKPRQQPVWTDISDRLGDAGITITTGLDDRQYLAAAGQCQLPLRNDDGAFDPNNSAGPWFGQIGPWNGLRVNVIYAGITTALFTGFFPRWPQAFDANTRRNTITVDARDIFSFLALEAVQPANVFTLDDPVLGMLDVGNVILGDIAFPQQTTGARINSVLDYAGIPAWMRQIDAGSTICAAAPPLSIDMLRYLEQIVATEAGRMYVRGDGVIVFEGRHHAKSDPAQSATTFTLHGSDLADVRYQPADDRLVANWIERGTSTDTVGLASDAASIAAYGRRRDSRTDLLFADPSEGKLQADWLLPLGKDPIDRFDDVVINPSYDPSRLFPIVLGAGLRRRFTMSYIPAGQTVPITPDLHVQKQVLRIVDLDWIATWQTAPVDDRLIFSLDVPVLDELDAGNLISY